MWVIVGSREFLNNIHSAALVPRSAYVACGDKVNFNSYGLLYLFSCTIAVYKMTAQVEQFGDGYRCGTAFSQLIIRYARVAQIIVTFYHVTGLQS